MSGASTSTYPENLASGGNSPGNYGAEFLFFLSVRHAKMLGTEILDGAYMHSTGGGNGHKPPGQF